MSEPKVHPSGHAYASWGQRFLAELLDGFIVTLPLLALAFAIPPVVAFAIPFLYNALLDGGARGQTIGKRVLRIRVVDVATGELIGPQRGMMRALPPLAFGVLALLSTSLYYVGLLLAMLDGLWALWDPQRQTWHDKVAGSIVVKV